MTGTIEQESPLGAQHRGHNAAYARRNKNRREDDAGGDDSPLDPGGERQAENARAAQSRSAIRPAVPTAMRRLPACPRQRRRVSLIGKEQQAGNPRDQRERANKRNELAQDIAEARDGMAEQDWQCVVGKIERDQARRDPRRQRQRQPGLDHQHPQKESSIDGRTRGPPLPDEQSRGWIVGEIDGEERNDGRQQGRSRRARW